MKTIELTDDNLRNIKVVLDYLLDSEQKHYEEYCSELLNNECGDNYDVILKKEFYSKPEIEHIYAMTRRVQDALNLSL